MRWDVNRFGHAPLWSTALFVAAMCACQFSTDYGNTKYDCGERDQCPGGFICWQGTCVETIPTADAAPEIDTAPAIDAAPPADGGPDAMDYCEDVGFANECNNNDVTAAIEAGGAVFFGDTGTTGNQMATPVAQCSIVDFPEGTQGADAFYTVNPTSVETLHALLTVQGDFHAAVYIVGGCLTGAACYDAAKVDPPGQTSNQVSAPVTVANTYHVVVDSHYLVSDGVPKVWDSGCYMLELWFE